MKTFKLGYQAPLKDTCAECELYNLQIRTAPPALWAMPLNSGWVPVKSRRLQDWQKLKKYVPNNKHGDVCPNGVPALPEKDSANDDSE